MDVEFTSPGQESKGDLFKIFADLRFSAL